MARPKRSVAPPHWRSEAQRSQVAYPTLLDVRQSRGLFPGVRGGEAKQAVKLENGGVMPMRDPKEAMWQEDHNGDELENGRAMHTRAPKEAMWQEDHNGDELENGRAMHTRAPKVAMWQEDHNGVELENGGVMHMRAPKEAMWQEDHNGDELENRRAMHMRAPKAAMWQEEHNGVELENGGVTHMRAPKEAMWQEDHNGVELEDGRVMHTRAQREAMFQENHNEEELEDGKEMHARAPKEAMCQEDHNGVELENGRAMHRRVKKEAVWQEDRIGVEHAGQQEDTLEKMPSLVGGGSSSLNMGIDRVDLAGSDQDLTLEEAVRGRRMPQGTQNFGKHGDDAKFMCTACGHSVAIVEVRAHPVLHVGVCGYCYDFLFSSPFTKDNPHDPFEHENECRWCGDGGEVILCDTCPKAFCKHCIKRNFGEDILKTIESPGREWSCFVCDDDHLQTLIHDYNNVENLVKTMNRSGQPRYNNVENSMKTTNRSGQPRKSRTSRVSNSRMRSGRGSRGPTRRSRNGIDLASETIATIIAGKKEKMQRRYPHTNFTGFARPQQHRHPQQHFLFAQNNTKREHDTSESGNPIPEGYVL